MMQTELVPSKYDEAKYTEDNAIQPTYSKLAEEDYDRAEQQFIQCLNTEDLDQHLESQAIDCCQFEQVLATAITTAYQSESDQDPQSYDLAHRFLQRILYRINRLKLFWYDDLQHYVNEQSFYLKKIQHQIETAWQQWEATQLDQSSYQSSYQEVDVKQSLIDRTQADVDPPLSEEGLFFRDRIGEAGYRRLVAIGSLDGLVEASQLSRTIGGVANEVHSVLTRLLVEEYGGGRLARKHSSYFKTMLEELDMQTEPEAYLRIVPWEVLAIINHSFFLTERKRYFLRYIGGLLYGELTVPATFRNYQAAGERLGLSDSAMSYWKLHIKVDELHGKWMLEDAALPLVDRYPEDAWKMVFGYDQQRLMSDRAGSAVTRSVQAAEQEG